MGVVLDTSALIEVERGSTDLFAHLGDLGDERAAIPAIVYAELQVGVRLADSPARARARRALILGFAVLLGHRGESHFERVAGLKVMRLSQGAT